MNTLDKIVVADLKNKYELLLQEQLSGKDFDNQKYLNALELVLKMYERKG